MAAPSYTTDLVLVNQLDTDATPAVGEPTGATAGTTIATETDHFVVGTACVSKIFNATGTGGLGYLAATAQTVPTDGAIYQWHYWAAPNSIETKANGGMQLIIGNSAANYRKYYIYGRDTVVYGGWKCFAVNPSVTPSANQGTPTATLQYFGVVANNALAVARGYPLAFDATRSGRGSIIMTAGDANGYATFLGAANTNDTNTTTGPIYNRWGILSLVGGTYEMQGRLAFGNTTVAVDFRDSNRNIVIQNTEYVTAGFNKFEIINSSSRVDWTGISVSALGTVSKGQFVVTDNATVNLDTCTFTDMDTFTFQANTNIVDTVFRRCNIVTQGNCSITSSTFDRASNTAALVCGSPAQVTRVTNTEFISRGAGHAIVINGSAANTTLSGITFTGYATSNGSTGNEAVFVNVATGSLTLSITNGGNTPTIRTAGATVTVENAKTFTVTNIIANSEVRILRQSDLVELAGAEVVSGTPSGENNGVVSADPDNAGRYRFTYSYGYTADIPIYVVVHALGYQWIRPSAVLKSENGSLQVSQTVDRQYSNG